jgi:hypothetical protein
MSNFSHSKNEQGGLKQGSHSNCDLLGFALLQTQHVQESPGDGLEADLHSEVPHQHGFCELMVVSVPPRYFFVSLGLLSEAKIKMGQDIFHCYILADIWRKSTFL